MPPPETPRFDGVPGVNTGDQLDRHQRLMRQWEESGYDPAVAVEIGLFADPS